jgi:hypothetical protein
MSEIDLDNIDSNLRNMLVDTCSKDLNQVELIEIVNQLICMVLALEKSLLSRTDDLDGRLSGLESGVVDLDEKVGQLSFDLAEWRGGL